MTEDPPAAPAGWYPTPSGDRRYWDGKQWLALPSPNDESLVNADLEPTNSAPGSDATAGDVASTTATKRKAPTRRTVWILVVAATAILLAVAGGVAWQASENAKAEVAAAAAAQEKAEKEELSAKKAEEEKEAAQKQADDSEREARKAAVTGIEESVEEMAIDHVEDDLITGPVISVSCSPVGGGSTEDLTETTTVFECFVANKDNGDGTMRGIFYNATMNWTTGSYTYGIGSP